MYEKVCKMLAQQLNIEVDKIKPESEVVKDLGADSLDAVELNMALEDNFSIKIPDEDIAKMKTVADVVAYIDANAAEGEAK